MRQFVSMRKRQFICFFAAVSVLTGLLLVLPKNPVLAATPTTINFQGKVVNGSGTANPNTNITDTGYTVIFRLYSVQSPTTTGTCTAGNNCLWEETDTVSTVNGVFQVELGSNCSFFVAAACNNSTPIDFSSNSLYLTMKFNSDVAGFMSPTMHFTGVPYAYYASTAANANSLGGISASGFIQNSASLQSSSNFHISGTGTADTALSTPILQTASGDLALQPASGIVALNKASTANELRVYENAVSPSNYASITATSNTATFKSNFGTTQIGNGNGAITLNAGAGAAINITGHTNSLWQTDAGTLTIQGGTTLSLLSTSTSGVTIDSGTTGAITVGAQNNTNAKSVSIGNNNAGSTVDIDAGTGATAIEIGNTTTAHGIQIGTNATGANAVSVGGDNAGSTLTLEGGTAAAAIQIGNGATAHGIQIGTGAAAQTLVIGSTSGASATTIQGGSNDITLNTTAGNNVIIGSATADANQVLLQTDSFSTFADTATCAAATNQGAMYFNTTSGSIRACVTGSNSTAGWEDLVSTAGLGIIAFGVVPDSPVNLGSQGDLAGIGASGANGSGPCKVYMGSTTATVSWTGCVAYSGGRRVVVAPGANQTPAKANNGWVKLCLNGTNNQPTFSANGAENLAANLPAFSANNPVLCLADISTSTSAVTGIYDARTFTTTTHDFVNISSATSVGLGTVVIASGTNAVTAAASATANILGVVVAWGGATTGTPNAVIATDGPTWAKATAGTAGAVVIPSATAGRVATGTSVAGPYGDLGMQRSATWSATCTAATASTCQLSIFFDMHLR